MKDWQDIALFVACAVAMILLPALFGFLAAIGATTLLPADFPMGWVVAGLSAVLLVGGMPISILLPTVAANRGGWKGRLTSCVCPATG